MKFVLISMLSAIAFVSQTESLRADSFDSNFFYYLRRLYCLMKRPELLRQMYSQSYTGYKLNEWRCTSCHIEVKNSRFRSKFWWNGSDGIQEKMLEDPLT